MSAKRSLRKYEQSQNFGVVASGTSNAIWASEEHRAGSGTRSTGAGLLYTGANEEVLCWDIKKNELISRWHAERNTAEVTTIARSHADRDIFAVGYADGSIRLWDSRIATVIIKFNGHRSAVTKLIFDKQGIKLASGSKDTDIIIWDLVTEAGLFTLRGHKDQITGLHFIQPPLITEDGSSDGTTVGSARLEDGFILSTSKDAMIKLWDVVSQYCVETHITQSNGECWALAVSPGDSGCITAGNEGELKIWTIDVEGLKRSASQLSANDEDRFLHERGTIQRQGRDRTTGVLFHPTKDYFAVHGADKAVELFRIKSQDEVDDALKRRKKRQAQKEKFTAQDNGNDDVTTNALTATTSDYFAPYEIIRTGGKVRSIDWTTRSGSRFVEIMVTTTNNQAELFRVVRGRVEDSKKASIEYDRVFAIEAPGHRNDIRAVSLSSDDRMLATASSGSLKVWNVRTRSCLRTLDCGYALCAAFLPGDKIVIVGNKSGELELFDIASSTLIDTVKAHDGPVWTLAVHPEGRSMATGSADKTVKFWNFAVVQDEIPGTRRTTPKFTLGHTRTMRVTDDILNICFSPDARLLAVATLDNTVKVFFSDSLKLFLNLYGHKLPVLHMSISSDSKLIATCSADKNIRLWGLDFGDCHKAFFAHDESIMQVSFIPHPISREDAHIFFSTSKDHLLKSWDGDKFEHIQKLRGHHGEIWAMTVSRTGDFLVTASHDKSIRVWMQTDEPLFLEEEREKDLEELYDTNLANSLEKDQANGYAAVDGMNGGVVPASKQTAETLTAGEKITEALTICTEDLEVVKEYDDSRAQNPNLAYGAPQRHPILTMRGLSSEAYLLTVFEAIPSAALQDALLLLSFSTLPALFVFLAIWLEKEMSVPLACRILFFLLQTHHRQIVASRELRSELQDMRQKLRTCLSQWKNMLGFNLAATKILGTRLREVGISTIEEQQTRVDTKTLKKRTFVNMA